MILSDNLEDLMQQLKGPKEKDGNILDQTPDLDFEQIKSSKLSDLDIV